MAQARGFAHTERHDDPTIEFMQDKARVVNVEQHGCHAKAKKTKGCRTGEGAVGRRHSNTFYVQEENLKNEPIRAANEQGLETGRTRQAQAVARE